METPTQTVANDILQRAYNNIQEYALVDPPNDSSSEDRWRKVLMQELHKSACQKASINMFKYLNKFSLITPFLTSGCHSDPFRARVETTADVIPRIWHPFLSGTLLHSAPLDMHGSPTRLPPPRQTYFNAVWLMRQPGTLAKVSCAEQTECSH